MKKQALKAAFPLTIPVMTGYLVLGMSYGVLMTAHGFPFWVPMVTTLLIYAGSMEFVLINLLLSAFSPLQAFLMTLMVNARHLFYGISMLERYKGTGLKKVYLIFGLTDESFSINCMAQPPEGVDRGWFYFFVTLLNQCYWFLGGTLGGLFGSLAALPTRGLDFVMTAMFVVIFLEQWLREPKHLTALLGVILPVGCLLLFGPERFMIPAMAAILLGLTLLRRPLEREVQP